MLKTRFAPSPTGLLHFGNARTALFNALFARRSGGVFVLRVEDTDLERSRPEFTQALQEDLLWLGMDWQEGVDRGGPAGPYEQSRRTGVYQELLSKLERDGRAYPCFCTPTELEISRKLQAASGRPPRYGGKCARLHPAEAEAKRTAGVAHTLRFRMPEDGVIEFDDLVRGPQKFASADIGDFIIRRSDGSFAFFFVNAVDDALMGVTYALRGEDHLSNTPRQIALLRALHLNAPAYGHISLIVDDAGAPLSKRTGSRSVRELREAGYMPQAVNNYLARLGHHYASDAFLDWEGLAQGFESGSLSRAPARYDPAQLNYWQAQAVLHLPLAELAAWVGQAVADAVPAADLEAFTGAIRDNVTFPDDVRRWAKAVYAPALHLSDAAREAAQAAGPTFFAAARAAILPEMDFKAFAHRVKQATGAQGKSLFLPLRAALTGEVAGPEMPRLFPLIGIERARARLAAFA